MSNSSSAAAARRRGLRHHRRRLRRRPGRDRRLRLRDGLPGCASCSSAGGSTEANCPSLSSSSSSTISMSGRLSKSSLGPSEAISGLRSAASRRRLGHLDLVVRVALDREALFFGAPARARRSRSRPRCRPRPRRPRARSRPGSRRGSSARGRVGVGLEHELGEALGLARIAELERDARLGEELRGRRAGGLRVERLGLERRLRHRRRADAGGGPSRRCSGALRARLCGAAGSSSSRSMSSASSGTVSAPAAVGSVSSRLGVVVSSPPPNEAIAPWRCRISRDFSTSPRSL